VNSAFRPYLKATHIVYRPSRLTHLRDSAHNTSHYADVTSDMALMSSDIFIWRISKSVTSVWHTLLFRKFHKSKGKADRSCKRRDQEKL